MDIEVVDDGKPDNNRELIEAMSSVKDVLLSQLESLKSIARWQDQTALYTSHLQNIKVDMNQVRKWGEPITHIAQRVDVIADNLTADATPQPDETPKEDATTLLPVLGEIAANTKMTYEAVQVLADATRESGEDKREVQEKVKPEGSKVRDKKAESGVKKHMSDAMGGVRDFFSKIMSWFAMAALFIAPLMVGPDQLFGSLKEFFGHLKKFFTAIAKFFLENVVPAISFLMEKLISFFNEISGPLGRLGTEIGHALKLIGPKLWNAVSPVLDAVGVGLVKAIDFFTVVVGKIGPALDVIGQFVSDIFAKFGGANDMVGNAFDKIGEFFESIMNKMKATNVEDMMDNLRISLQGMFNSTMDALYEIMTGMIKMYVDFKSPGNTQLLRSLVEKYAAPLQEAKFNIDRSSQRATMVDFNQSDAHIERQLDQLEAQNLITGAEKQTMSENKEHFKLRQHQRADHSLERMDAIVHSTDIGVAEGGFGYAMRIGLYELKGLLGAVPGIEHDTIVMRESSPGSGDIDRSGYWHGPGAKDRAIGIADDGEKRVVPPDVKISPTMGGILENLVRRGITPVGKNKIGTKIPTLPKSELDDLTPIELKRNIGTEVSKLSTSTTSSSGGGGGGNQNNQQIVAKGPTNVSAFSIHKSGDPTVEFGRQ